MIKLSLRLFAQPLPLCGEEVAALQATLKATPVKHMATHFITPRRCSLRLFLAIILLGGATSFQSVAAQAKQPDAARTSVAILGLVHSHGWGHLSAIAKMSDVDLVGIADTHADLREAAAKVAPGVALYEDYIKLLDEKKPKIAWAFVENDRHVELTKACAVRGIHVMFEKPMAATFDQATEMLRLAKQHNIKMLINYQMAWWPENYTAHDLAESGDLGKVWRVRAIIGHGGPAPTNADDVRRKYFWAWLNDERRGGGALLDFTVYGAAWFRWYLGMPQTVYAIKTHTRPDVYKSNTNATVLATFPNNGVGMIEGSWDLPRSFQDVEVFGDKGSVYMARNKLEVYAGGERKDLAAKPLSAERRHPVTYFIERVRTGQPIEGIVSPEFNVDVMQIVEATKRSAESGKPITLPLAVAR